MARKHGKDWIPLVANDWGATYPNSHKSPPTPPLSKPGEGDRLPRKLITTSYITHRNDLMALRLNQVGGIARLTREGFRHPSIPLGYLRSVGNHGNNGGGIHSLTNDEASMPNSIYLGAETHLITDHDNDSIKVYTHQPRPHPCWA
jgi:hypothetical protein